MLDRFERFINNVAKIETGVSTSLFVVMLSLMFVQVICRYVLKIPLGWSEEILRYMYVATTFIGAAVATHERSHIEINVIEVLIEKKTQDLEEKMKYGLIVNVFRDLLTAGVMCFISYKTFSFLIDTYNFHTVSTAVQLPMWIVVAFMFVGFVMCVVHAIGLIILNLNGRGTMGYEFGGEDTTCNL